jgi:hypothetical protein
MVGQGSGFGPERDLEAGQRELETRVEGLDVDVEAREAGDVFEVDLEEPRGRRRPLFGRGGAGGSVAGDGFRKERGREGENAGETVNLRGAK